MIILYKLLYRILFLILVIHMIKYVKAYFQSFNVITSEKDNRNGKEKNGNMQRT